MDPALRRRHNPSQLPPAPRASLPAQQGPRKPPEDTAPRPSVDVMELTVPCCPSREAVGGHHTCLPPWLVQGRKRDCPRPQLCVRSLLLACGCTRT